MLNSTIRRMPTKQEVGQGGGGEQKLYIHLITDDDGGNTYLITTRQEPYPTTMTTMSAALSDDGVVEAGTWQVQSGDYGYAKIAGGPVVKYPGKNYAKHIAVNFSTNTILSVTLFTDYIVTDTVKEYHV